MTAGLLTLISIMGMREMLKVYSLDKSSFAVVDYLATVLLYVFIYLNQTQFLFPFVLVVLIVLLTVYVCAFPKYKDTDMMKSFFVFVYVAVLLSYVLRIRSMEAGILLAFFILISSWVNDIFAYFVGSTIGKHKFSPKVSPNKSIEGFFGGIIGAGFIGLLFGLIFEKYIPFSGVACVVIAALGAIPAVIGDLAASAIKRDNGIKDYSNLIPGHGGIIDRIDSILFTAPIIYYLVELFHIL